MEHYDIQQRWLVVSSETSCEKAVRKIVKKEKVYVCGMKINDMPRHDFGTSQLKIFKA